MMRSLWVLVALCAEPASPQQRHPFPALWNEKWPQDCPSSNATRRRRAALVASFGVQINKDAAYYGPAANDVVNTMGAFGLWPHYARDGSRFNGGLPQRGNLTRHLERVRADVARYIPSPLYRGAAVIDFEQWHPVYDANNYGAKGVVGADYQNESKNWVQQRHPSWGSARVEASARQEFDDASREFMEQTLLLCKALRPHASWGYYGYPSCGKCGNSMSPPCGECPQVGMGGGMAANDRLGWLWENSDVLYPGIYLCCSTNHEARNQSFVRAAMAETQRVMAGAEVSLPIFPYIWPSWEDEGGGFLDPATLEMLLSTIVQEGGDGVVVWGAKTDALDAAKCDAFERFLNASLGPMLEHLPY